MSSKRRQNDGKNDVVDGIQRNDNTLGSKWRMCNAYSFRYGLQTEKTVRPKKTEDGLLLISIKVRKNDPLLFIRTPVY